ncbi:uncharacterized protein L969DRAFT_76906 [Mixia osmundae IAM 14324]|uniref:Uncharacterized protein n=1 Tax=Mixia osmundae (strain CBS 9802 / IAM 14324 / JCM 22182 / KY 12970) TaxID=764103 RepID=G7EAA8_MIXOS|nr:uncharacterized protein L969DRAFT_76906 [Mixia osmundae IAM 14324]KEI37827.1 hypothetical protein L969DRAFT_76906 [Mixia osmundae IAM 14324]GAA99768.1 hypothetical protein E5Q_06471 [Mixia osmundae IAM 14324]
MLKLSPLNKLLGGLALARSPVCCHCECFTPDPSEAHANERTAAHEARKAKYDGRARRAEMRHERRSERRTRRMDRKAQRRGGSSGAARHDGVSGSAVADDANLTPAPGSTYGGTRATDSEK